jgi:hypothetical protein
MSMPILTEVEIRTPAPRNALAGVVAVLHDAFPGLPVRGRRSQPPPGRTITCEGTTVVVPSSVWRAGAFDPLELDEAVARVVAGDGRFALRVDDDQGSRAGVIAGDALEVVTRCQRHLTGRNEASATPLFDAILAQHRVLHDRSLPLVAADHDHALDTWRWVLRLEPQAGLAVQVAALFHDVERLASEARVRVEQHAPDYAAFKDAHAAAGAQIATATLHEVGAPAALVSRVAELVATHERPGDDPDKRLVNEADALSFFSLNAPGFARYYGPAHTAKKVAYTVARLEARGRAALSGIRHRADIAELIMMTLERHPRCAAASGDEVIALASGVAP